MRTSTQMAPGRVSLAGAFVLRASLALRATLALAALGSLPACSDDDDGPRDAGTDALADGEAPFPQTPYDGVDVFVGTGGDGFGVGSTYPGASLPFGMVKLSPDTGAANGSQAQWSHCAGYAYDDTVLLGFSHTHMSGIGVPGYGNLRLMPALGLDPAQAEPNGAATRYPKASEAGAPGYYTVTLDHGVQVELSAGLRSGYHRWTWPVEAGPDDAVVWLDLAATLVDGRPLGGEITVDATAGRLHGFTYIDDQQGEDFRIWFDARFRQPILGHGTWADGTLTGDATAAGTEVGAYVVLEVGADGAAEAMVGISWVDADGARQNREEDEAGAASFDEARAAAKTAWQEVLGLVDLEGGTGRTQRIFWSALYRAFLHPTLFTDADGRYRGLDRQVHLTSRRYYTDFSLWDTYRTLHPLLILLAPAESADMAQSLVHMAEQWGGLPKWPMADVEAGSMIGSPADPVLAESFLKGVDDFDVEAAWPVMWARANGPVAQGGRAGIEEYVAMGYVPADVQGGSVSKTQEYQWNDFSLMQLAIARGLDSEAATLRERSRTLANLWDPSVGFFRGRLSDGSWDPSFSETSWEDYFVEGDAWQHVWLTPWPDLLTEILGGRDALVAKLDELFHLSKEDWEWSALGYWAPLPYYWHGNEPDIHAPYFYAAAGRPEGTQRWVEWVRRIHYGLGPKGLAGNDDCGTLSAWYVFSSLGIYPWAGSDLYVVGTPAFDRAVVHLEGGDLVIEVAGRPSGPFVQEASLDGAPLAVPWLRHADIASGGTLSFTLGADPSTWGVTDDWPF